MDRLMQVAANTFEKRTDDIFLYSVGRVRALETRLLDRDILRDLIEAPTLKDIFNELRDTEYGEAIVATEDNLDFERFLLVAAQNLIKLIDSFFPEPKLVSLFVYPFDVQNLKILLKANLAGLSEPVRLYTLGRFDPFFLRALIEQGSSRDLPGWMASAVMDVRNQWKKQPKLRIVDAILDRALVLAQLQTAINAQRPVLVSFFRHLIDTSNVEAFVRIRISERSREQFEQFFIPEGELPLSFFKNVWETGIRELDRIFENTAYHNMVVKSLEEYHSEGSLTLLEVEKDRLLMDRLDPARYITFGPEPVLAYLVTRLYEIKILRLIMVARKNHLPGEELQKRVMMYYA